MIPTHEDNHGRDDSTKEGAPRSPILDAQAQSMGALMESGAVEEEDVGAYRQNVTGKTDADLLQIVKQAERQSSTFMQTYVHPKWQRSLKAFANEHFEDSKYLSARFRARSKVFRPKTRAAVRKNMTAAVNALFSTADVVQITASDKTNPRQNASAAVKQELLNYRLDRSSTIASLPWFQTASGANQQAQIFSFCCSKQMWLFRERTVKSTVQRLDPVTRAMVPMEIERKVKDLDRPECINIAPENVLFDPNCDWRKPAQSSPYLQVRFPMSIHEIMEKIKASAGTPQPWNTLTESELNSLASATPIDVQSTRRARRHGAEPEDHVRVDGYRNVWVIENFFRFEGEDYTFWTVGTDRLLSAPVATRDAYPAHHGERPYVIGFGAIEANNPIPMSPVESWQQLQQEANDIANLRLDGMKHTINPVRKVKRGKQVDIEQMQRLGPDGVIMLTDMEDVSWDRAPDVPASAFAETNYINADFDDLAGAFGGSTVQTNRSLNETVGGMAMMNAAAGSVTEFDLRVWIETWVEPVLTQIVQLEEFYEDDETILTIAGMQGQLIEKFNVDEITDELLREQTTLRVDVGVGAADPMQKLAKFMQAAKAAGDILLPFVQAGQIKVTPKPKDIIDEVFGMAGIKQAGERFFDFPQAQGQPGAPGEDPAAQAQAEAQAQAAGEQAKIEADMQAKAAEMQHESQENALDRQHEMRKMAVERETKTMLQQIAGQQKTASDQQKARSALVSAMMKPPPAPPAARAPARPGAR